MSYYTIKTGFERKVVKFSILMNCSAELMFYSIADYDESDSGLIDPTSLCSNVTSHCGIL